MIYREGDVLNSGPVVMDRVRPMTRLWIMIPICSTCGRPPPQLHVKPLNLVENTAVHSPGSR